MQNIFLVVYSILGMVVLFTVPYLFPSKIPTISASYDYGFNNKIGMLILILLCFGLIVWGWLSSRKKKLSATEREYNDDNDSLAKTFNICMIFQILICLIIWFLVRDTLGVGESSYFIQKLHDLIIGRKLYSEVDFIYGSILLYVPLYLYKLINTVFKDVRIQDVYLLSMSLFQCFGFYELYKVFSKIKIDNSNINTNVRIDDNSENATRTNQSYSSSHIKEAIFILIFIATLPLTSGLNYVLFRFITPFMVLCYLWNGEDSIFLYSLKLCIAVPFMINISPEIGIAFSFTLIVANLIKFCLNKTKSSERNIRYILYSLISLLTMIACFILTPNLLIQLRSFLSGGSNWPFLLSFVHVFFFSIVFLLAFNIGKQVSCIRQNVNLLTLELLACSMIPGALGRGDPGHLIFNGLFVFMIAASFIRKVALQKIYVGLLLIFVILCCPYHVVVYGKSYGVAMLDNHIVGEFFNSKIGSSLVYSVGKALGVDEEKITKRLRQKNSANAVPDILENISDVSMPFDGNNVVYCYLGDNEKYHYLPFSNALIAGGSEIVNRNLSALKSERPKYLLLPKEWQKLSNPASYTRDIALLFMIKYTKPQKYNGCEILTETVRYIDSAYKFFQDLDMNLSLYKLR